MIRYRPNEFFLVAVYLHPVLELPNESNRILLFQRLVGARCALATFTNELIDNHLPATKTRAARLIQDIDRVTLHSERDAAGMPNLQSIQSGIRKFEMMLDEEVSSAPIFCLEAAGNLSTERLLGGASKGFDPTVAAILPTFAISEIDESGRCLAFERPTASAFHILRAVELSIKNYLKAVPNFCMPPLNRQNWGEFIKLLKDNGASKQVVDTLENIKSNYRNPLMHPEDVLDLREAVSLFSLCQGVIEFLVEDMKNRGLV